MNILDIAERVVSLLRQRGRVSYNALKVEFGLDESQFEALKDELLFTYPEVENMEGRGFVLNPDAGRDGSDSAEIDGGPNSADDEAAPAEAERRQLTVMFCDLCDSTAISERLDAEDWQNVLQVYQLTVSRIIEGFEGSVIQLLGDGVLAYFGHPQAHEDDAERAIRAGLKIVSTLRTHDLEDLRRYGIELAARVGIHTGPVVIGEMGGGQRSERLAVGTTTAIAARIEHLAERNTVAISEDTFRLVSGLFATESLGDQNLKGVSKPVPVYTVMRPTGMKSRLDIDESRLSPLVGRDQEIGLLIDRWERVQDGEGQTVLVSADAGVGKSRVLRAFRNHLADARHSWFEAQCSAFTKDSAFHPMIETIRDSVGIRADDPPTSSRRRLEASLTAAGLSLPDTVPVIASLLGLDFSDSYEPIEIGAEMLRAKMLDSLASWILALAEAQPLILLVEDLHWSDASTLEILGLLIEQSPRVPLLLLLTFRPEFEPPWKTRSHVSNLDVTRLRAGQAERLVRSLDDDGCLADDVVTRIVEHGDGVPLHLEELTKSVLASGDDALTVPSTLHDSLMARLDHFNEAKTVAQIGATMGREFSYEMTVSLELLEPSALERGLAHLVEAEIIYQRGNPPQAVYTFKHALVQDVAYESLLKRTRRNYHRRVAEILEDRSRESEPLLIAHHLTEAGLIDRAIVHWRVAAENYLEKSSYREAIGNATRGIELLDDLEDETLQAYESLRVHLVLGAAIAATEGFASDNAEVAFRHAAELAGDSADRALRTAAFSGLTSCYLQQGKLRDGVALAERSLEHEASGEVDASVVWQHLMLSWFKYLLGEPESAVENADIVIASKPKNAGIDTSGFHVDLYACADGFAAKSLRLLGYPEQATARASSTLTRANELEHPQTLAFANYVGAVVYQFLGDVARTRTHTIALLDFSTENDLSLWQAWGTMFSGWLLIMEEEVSEGIGALRESIHQLRSMGSGSFQPYGLALLGDALLMNHQIDEGLNITKEALDIIENTGERCMEAEIYRIRGELLIASGADKVTVDACFRKALEVSRNQAAKALELRSASGLARYWQKQGRVKEGHDLLAPILDWYREGLDTHDVAAARAWLEGSAT